MVIFAGISPVLVTPGRGMCHRATETQRRQLQSSSSSASPCLCGVFPVYSDRGRRSHGRGFGPAEFGDQGHGDEKEGDGTGGEEEALVLGVGGEVEGGGHGGDGGGED